MHVHIAWQIYHHQQKVKVRTPLSQSQISAVFK